MFNDALRISSHVLHVTHRTRINWIRCQVTKYFNTTLEESQDVTFAHWLIKYVNDVWLEVLAVDTEGNALYFNKLLLLSLYLNNIFILKRTIYSEKNVQSQVKLHTYTQ